MLETIIKKFEYYGPPQDFVRLYEFFPDKTTGLKLCLFAAVFYVFTEIFVSRREFVKIKQGWLAAVCFPAFLALTGTFLSSLGYIDEVFVNLEHPYNLYHHGFFSISPVRIADGTVEILYYLALTPFAKTQNGLVLANVIFGFVITLAHLILFMKIFPPADKMNRFLAMLFSLHYPLISILSSGFGNGLVSLTLFACILLLLRKNYGAALLVASLMPLLRPDGILYSYAVILAGFESYRRSLKPGTIILFFSLPVLFLGGYFLLFHHYYGNWIPAPMTFKVPALSALELVSRDRLLERLRDWSFPIMHVLFILICFIQILFRDFKTEKIELFSRNAFFFGIIFLFYSVNAAAGDPFEGKDVARYWAGFELVVALYAMAGICRMRYFLDKKKISMVFKKGPLFFVGFMTLIVFSLQALQYNRVLKNREGLSFAGQISAQIIPEDFSISASEMNTFGYMIPGKEVIDLWGYSNREISKSHLCNAQNNKNNPDFFIRKKPDIYWPYPSFSFFEIESDLADFHQISKTGNLLGDLHAVLKEYHIYCIGHPRHNFIYLVKKEKAEKLEKKLIEKNFKLQAARKFDFERFSAIYDKQKPSNFVCNGPSK